MRVRVRVRLVSFSPACLALARLAQVEPELAGALRAPRGAVERPEVWLQRVPPPMGCAAGHRCKAEQNVIDLRFVPTHW